MISRRVSAFIHCFISISGDIFRWLVYNHTGPFVRCFTISLSSSKSRYYFTQMLNTGSLPWFLLQNLWPFLPPLSNVTTLPTSTKLILYFWHFTTSGRVHTFFTIFATLQYIEVLVGWRDSTLSKSSENRKKSIASHTSSTVAKITKKVLLQK